MLNHTASDYKTLKQTKNLKSVLNNRSSSISAVRIEREFNTNSPSKQRKDSIDAAYKAEKLIQDLVLHPDDEADEQERSLMNETLPGSCKS